MNNEMNGYICFYKKQRTEIHALSSYAAQQQAAIFFKAKKPYEVSVCLAEKDDKPVSQPTT